MGNKASSGTTNTSSRPQETQLPLPHAPSRNSYSNFRHSHSLFKNSLSQNRTSGSDNRLNLVSHDIRQNYNVVEDILRECDTKTRNIHTTQQAITTNFSNQAYDIFRNSFLKYRTTPVDQSNFDDRLAQNVNAKIRESEAKIRSLQQQRARLEASLLTDRESKKPEASIESCIDQSDRYSKFRFWDTKYFSPKPERPVLTNEMLLAIKDASRYEPANETLVEIDGVQIMRKDMKSLTGSQWLNDEIINAYLHLIVLRGREKNRMKVYAFNTFFYPKLRESGYNSVKRWTRKVDIFSYHFLLVPVHLGNHWCLAFISFLDRTISYYDSMGGSTHNCCDTLLDYLRYESSDKKKQDFDDENWRTINCYSDTGIPQQLNFSDCGVFACQFAEHLTRQVKLNFTQEHMPYFRRKMIYELLTKRILE